LYSDVGSLSQQAIVDYLAPYLRTAINRILTAFPRDSIFFEIPNPMTARPYNASAGFPSPTAYPSFGNVAADDQALVEKWNQALRATYILVQNELSKTKLVDSWELVFGKSDTTLVAGTQIPFLANLVHPSGVADSARILEFAKITKSKFVGVAARKLDAEARSVILSVNPWEVYPGYLRDNLKYRLAMEVPISAIGSNYIDFAITYSEFIKLVSGPIYIVIGDRVAQYFATYTAGVQASLTRLTNVSPNSTMQLTAGNSAQIFSDNVLKIIANDLYVNTLALASKEYIDCTITGAGVGFIDILMSVTLGSISTKYLSGLQGGSLVVGGSINASLALSTLTTTRSGATSLRRFRISVTGDYSAYASQPAAITFSTDVPSPKSFDRIPKLFSALPHAQGNKAYIFQELRLSDGAQMGISMLSQSFTPVTVDVYSLGYASRVLIGTITVASNAPSGVLTSGNPTLVGAGVGYEFAITSSTSQSVPIICTLTPL
jgi:hypothetical protein